MELILYENFGLKENLDVLTLHIWVCMYAKVQQLPITAKYVFLTKEKKILKDQKYLVINILS